MLKKLLIATAVMASTTGISLAYTAAPYIGASTGINTVTTSNGGVFRGVPATVFGGYGVTIDQTLYLAGELFGTLGTLNLNNGPTNIASLRTTSGYGIGFLPGIMLADHTLAFLRVGLINSYFSTLRSSSMGAQLGLGMQTSLTQNWDIRGEYNYNSYKSIVGITPRSDLFNVGVVYKIN